MATKQVVEYSFWIGLGKSVKNVAVTIIPPAVAVLANNYADWVPESWYPVAVPLISLVSYLVKNYYKFKAENPA